VGLVLKIRSSKDLQMDINCFFRSVFIYFLMWLDNFEIKLQQEELLFNSSQPKIKKVWKLWPCTAWVHA